MRHRFLPIAERELLGASRRKMTFRLRWSIALIGIAASFIWYLSSPAAILPASFVASLFNLQTACAFGFALLAGPFLTSDCLSEEKRDGTLGLLFLTGLKAPAIILGKFAGTSVNAIFMLLTLVPVTAVPLLLGGVSGAEFWRVALSLVNALFFSLAAGLSVSAFATDYSRGLVITLALLALFGVAFPVAAELGPMLRAASAWSWFSWFSPSCPFRYARDLMYVSDPTRFWVPLVVSHLLGWTGLALAALHLGHSWKDTRLESLARRTSPPRPASMTMRRNKPHDDVFEPLLRLAGRTPFLRSIVWFIVLAWAALVLANRFWPLPGLGSLFAAKTFGFALKILVAFQACRFFVETRRSGAMELLFCTPLRNADLVRAQWRGLLRVFFWPLAIFLLFAWANVAFVTEQARVSPGSLPSPDFLAGLKTGYLGAGILSIGLAADILAVGWFGMWLALRVGQPGLAPGLTILAVLVLPAMLSYFDLVVDMLFISWGTTRFQEEFRWHAAAPIIRSGREAAAT